MHSKFFISLFLFLAGIYGIAPSLALVADLSGETKSELFLEGETEFVVSHRRKREDSRTQQLVAITCPARPQMTLLPRQSFRGDLFAKVADSPHGLRFFLRV